MYTPYIYRVFKKISLGFDYIIDNKFYTVYSTCDVIKIDITIKQDRGWIVSFALQYSRHKQFEKLSMLPQI